MDRRTTADARLSPGRAESGQAFLLASFLVLLVLPISFEVAGLRLSPYRVFLLLLFVPFLLQLFSGRAGPMNLVDLCVACFAIWMIVTLVFHHGGERFPYASILAVEVLGGYLVGRLLVRSSSDYERFIRFFLLILAMLAPIALFELFQSRMLLSDFFRPLFDVTKKNYAFRFGLSRVQVAFPHSILYGVFCSLALASVYYIYRKRPLQMVPRYLLVVGMAFMSLSSGPLLSVVLQTFMIIWDKVTRGRWKLLAVLVGSIYLFLEVASNRGAVIIFIESFTLDPQTGWWRIHIWRHGSASVLNHPIMGIGLNDWVRPDWLKGSVDNFWLLMAMRHGLVGLAFLGLAVSLHIAYVLRSTPPDEGTRSIRTGYGVTLAGLLFVLSTVHVWNEVSVFVMFFFGAGAFLYSANSSQSTELDDTPDTEEVAQARHLQFSRFPKKSRADRAGRAANGVKAESGAEHG